MWPHGDVAMWIYGCLHDYIVISLNRHEAIYYSSTIYGPNLELCAPPGSPHFPIRYIISKQFMENETQPKLEMNGIPTDLRWLWISYKPASGGGKCIGQNQKTSCRYIIKL